MLTVAIPKRNKLQNIIVLTPKDGVPVEERDGAEAGYMGRLEIDIKKEIWEPPD